jgi:transposase
VLVRKQLRRGQVLRFVANTPRCMVGMEACSGAHYWAREIAKLGHGVRLMNPQFVKPYVKSNKNDRNDAEAICEVVARPSDAIRVGIVVAEELIRTVDEVNDHERTPATKVAITR